jgi:pimeloyl-ACP methyl ester carboxylesterase
MGGFSSLSLLRKHPANVRAVALWAAAMPSDFSDLKVPMLFLWGDRDGLLPAGRLADVRARLPATTRFVTLTGGNHQDFALYTHQFFDNAGDLGWQAQTAQANAETAAFFASHAREPR